MQILNKANLIISDIASKDKSKEILGCVAVTDKYTFSTDGNCLIKCDTLEFPDDDYPGVANFTPENSAGFQIPTESARKLIKSLPKKSKLPVDQLIGVGKNCEGNIAVTNDLENATIVRMVKNNMPKIEHVIPTSEPVITIKLNAALLARVCETLDKMSITGNIATFSFYDQLKAVKIEAKTEDGQNIMALVMPIRGN